MNLPPFIKVFPPEPLAKLLGINDKSINYGYLIAFMVERRSFASPSPVKLSAVQI